MLAETVEGMQTDEADDMEACTESGTLGSEQTVTVLLWFSHTLGLETSSTTPALCVTSPLSVLWSLPTDFLSSTFDPIFVLHLIFLL